MAVLKPCADGFGVQKVWNLQVAYKIVFKLVVLSGSLVQCNLSDLADLEIGPSF